MKSSLTQIEYKYDIKNFKYNKNTAERLIQIQNDIEHMSRLIGYLNENKEKGFSMVRMINFMRDEYNSINHIGEFSLCPIIEMIKGHCFYGFLEIDESIDFFDGFRELLSRFIIEYDEIAYQEKNIIYLTSDGQIIIDVLAYVSSHTLEDITLMIESIYKQWIESEKNTIDYKEFGECFSRGIFSRNKNRIIYNLKL